VVALCAAASLALGQPDPATAATPGSGGLEVDPASGLVIDAGWELVRGHCSACHSARLVIQNRGSRETWLSMIRWMQESQGLWQFDPATEATILDYLSRNYGPMASSRRAPLPSDQLPVNPYARKGAP
jgi:mono/diheme cytochrome c family protein